jgi:hypothetical protein
VSNNANLVFDTYLLRLFKDRCKTHHQCKRLKQKVKVRLYKNPNIVEGMSLSLLRANVINICGHFYRLFLLYKDSMYLQIIPLFIIFTDRIVVSRKLREKNTPPTTLLVFQGLNSISPFHKLVRLR